jgi:hypothetical protein
MEKEFKNAMERSKEALQQIEQKVEKHTGEMGDDLKAYWNEIKQHLEGSTAKLQEKYEKLEGEAELKTHLLLMESRDRLESVKENMDTLLSNLTHQGEKELDIAALKAHLAKLEAQEEWKEKEKAFLQRYAKSKADADKLAKKAAKEINEIYLKLTEIV